MLRRLADSPSPYLRQHAQNPVEWYAWGDEPFERAVREDKPVFLSVGYSACHWCHVMAHESFEDREIARVLNSHFVCVKVDREERPDVDETYMVAVQLSSGQGGWPMSVFLTPDRRPFFAGTYFPPRSSGGRVGFQDVAEQLATAWRDRRADIEQAAEEFRTAIEQVLAGSGSSESESLGLEHIDGAVQALQAEYDARHGGFGGAPKFPPHSALRLLQRVAESNSPEAPQARSMLIGTLRAIALGGIHDLVGGGFHRYSTDVRWLLPHFEKMLYDNALLLDAYSMAQPMVDAADRPLFARAQRGIVDWMTRELQDSTGFFASALDADSEGDEGRYYTWTSADIRRVLGEESDAAIQGFGVQPDGNYRDEATRLPTGRNVLYLPNGTFEGMDTALARLASERSLRVRPATDDKAILAWNAMAIRGLAAAGETEAADRCAQCWLEVERRHGRLPHMVAQGDPHGQAFLDDYAWFVDALLRLDSVGLLGYREEAERVAASMVALFWNSERVAFSSTSDEHETVIARSWPVFDAATPAPSAAAISALIQLGQLDFATRALTSLSGRMVQAPRATLSLHSALFDLLSAAGQGVRPIPGSARSKIGLSIRWEGVQDGGCRQGTLIVEMPTGWSIVGDRPASQWLTPMELRFPGLDATVEYPTSELGVYSERIEVPFRILNAGSRARIDVELLCQPCTPEGCQMPQRMRFQTEVPGSQDHRPPTRTSEQ